MILIPIPLAAWNWIVIIVLIFLAVSVVAAAVAAAPWILLVPLPALFTKVQIRPPKGVIGAGMGLGHRRLQAQPGFEQPTGGA